jgi:apolipoprotein N-acyltransferase
LRLAFFPSSYPTVRIASLSRSDTNSKIDSTLWYRYAAGTATEGDIKTIRAWQKKVNNDLFERAAREAVAGAKIIFWGETNASVLQDDEDAIIARGSKFASDRKIYLGMGLVVWNRPNAPKAAKNELVFIKPDGTVAWVYQKTHPVPGDEAALIAPGSGELPYVDTPYGRVTAAICFDADFPDLLVQAGRFHADIVLNPSNEWPAIDPQHAEMASFRAIENGFSIVHQASDGFSAGFDYYGDRLSAMDYATSSDQTMVTEVPIHGIHTLYSLLGDWFATLCLLGLGVLLSAALLKRPESIRQS